jgi:hypothetical protein
MWRERRQNRYRLLKESAMQDIQVDVCNPVAIWWYADLEQAALIKLDLWIRG